MIACTTVFGIYLYTHASPIYRMHPRCVRVVLWVAQTSELMSHLLITCVRVDALVFQVVVIHASMMKDRLLR